MITILYFYASYNVRFINRDNERYGLTYAMIKCYTTRERLNLYLNLCLSTKFWAKIPIEDFYILRNNVLIFSIQNHIKIASKIAIKITGNDYASQKFFESKNANSNQKFNTQKWNIIFDLKNYSALFESIFSKAFKAIEKNRCCVASRDLNLFKKRSKQYNFV